MRVQPAPWVARVAGRAALGLLAQLKSPALRHRETWVAGKGSVPYGTRAAKVGGAPPCLVELRVPASSAKPWRCAQLQPSSIRRPVRHERQTTPDSGAAAGGPLADSVPVPDAGSAPAASPCRASATHRHDMWCVELPVVLHMVLPAAGSGGHPGPRGKREHGAGSKALFSAITTLHSLTKMARLPGPGHG